MGTLLLLKVPAMTLPAEKNTAELSRQALMSLGEQGLVLSPVWISECTSLKFAFSSKRSRFVWTGTRGAPVKHSISLKAALLCGLQRKFKVASPFIHISSIPPLYFLIQIHICAALPTFHIYQQSPLMFSENLCRSFSL